MLPAPIRTEISTLAARPGAIGREPEGTLTGPQPPDRVVFGGYRQDIPKILELADVVVFSSLRKVCRSPCWKQWPRKSASWQPISRASAMQSRTTARRFLHRPVTLADSRPRSQRALVGSGSPIRACAPGANTLPRRLHCLEDGAKLRETLQRPTTARPAPNSLDVVRSRSVDLPGPFRSSEGL